MWSRGEEQVTSQVGVFAKVLEFQPLTDGDIHRSEKLEIWPRRGSVQGALTVGLVRQCQTIHGRDRTCIPPRLPPEWVTTLFFIIMGIISLTVTCGLLVASHWRREATKYARWIAFTGRLTPSRMKRLKLPSPRKRRQ
ncbi:modulator of smoothened protein isoform X3 [Balearica regulorum gibbericeps]|uniref:modulator of smoothened protein isoform X3 n=1 Tax=Balearica regulorum gibbericeps TaxID=100784 RepID=UPI003F5EB83B